MKKPNKQKMLNHQRKVEHKADKDRANTERCLSHDSRLAFGYAPIPPRRRRTWIPFLVVLAILAGIWTLIVFLIG